MDKAKIKERLPTVFNYLEKRRQAKRNRLPKHLRPMAIWPIAVQLVLNTGLIITLANLMVDRDDFMTEAAPAIGLVICFLVLIYTLISAVRLKRTYHGIRGGKWATLNLWMMVLAFLFWAGSIVVFLP